MTHIASRLYSASSVDYIILILFLITIFWFTYFIQYLHCYKFNYSLALTQTNRLKCIFIGIQPIIYKAWQKKKNGVINEIYNKLYKLQYNFEFRVACLTVCTVNEKKKTRQHVCFVLVNRLCWLPNDIRIFRPFIAVTCYDHVCIRFCTSYIKTEM